MDGSGDPAAASITCGSTLGRYRAPPLPILCVRPDDVVGFLTPSQHMRGHLALIAMRCHGAVPEVVWIDTDGTIDPCCDDWLDITPQHAHLQLQPSDVPSLVDLRCVTRLFVSISGSDIKRVRSTRDACISAGAKRVIASTTRQIRSGRYPEFELVEVTDTAGHLIHPLRKG